MADELGLRSLATASGHAGNRPVTIHLGILDSIRFGDLEIRDIPMRWTNQPKPALPDGAVPRRARHDGLLPPADHDGPRAPRAGAPAQGQPVPARPADTTVEVAERAGIPVDYSNPGEINGRPVYPITAERISLGRAVGHDVRGSTSAGPVEGTPGPGQSALER